jgi:hypothetical protein
VGVVNPACLINLSAAHAKAPGVLDRVFGKDGDFEGAPNFTGPILHRDRYLHVQTRRGQIGTLKGRVCDGVSCLDPRVPTVGARIAWLCAQAMGYTAPSVWGVTVSATTFSLRGVPVAPGSMWETAPEFTWERRNGRAMSYPGAGAVHMDLPALASATDVPSFLAALFMELAPQIVALGGAR